VVGKTNAPRWSGDMQTFNELFGTTRNPWDPERTCGGSSGGAAVAVACGFSSFEVGTDIGGSIRIPTHFCGLYGLRPTWGVVPQRGYLDHVGGGTTDADINVVGPIARAAEDLELLLDVLAGPDGDAGTAWRLELPEADLPSLSELRVGVWLDDPFCPVESEYAQRLQAAAAALGDAGARVVEARPALDAEELFATYWKLLMAAISPSFPDQQAEALAGSHREWLRMTERRAAFARAWRDFFAEHHVLLCPVVAMPAFPHDHSPDMSARTVEIDGEPRPYVDSARWTGIVGSVGVPAVSAPIGRTSDGLPVGVQIVAPWYRDRRAIRVAAWLGELMGGYEPPPL
jgi:amidase